MSAEPFLSFNHASTVVLGVGLSAAVVLSAVKALVRVCAGSPSYRADPLLSEWERRTLADLQAIVPAGWHICPQVRLADFLSAEGGTKKANWAANARIRQRSVDFLLIDATAAPRLVIELDDSSHFRSDRRRRDAQNDAAYRQAGIPVRHIRPGRPPDWTCIIGPIIVEETGTDHQQRIEAHPEPVKRDRGMGELVARGLAVFAFIAAAATGTGAWTLYWTLRDSSAPVMRIPAQSQQSAGKGALELALESVGWRLVWTAPTVPVPANIASDMEAVDEATADAIMTNCRVIVDDTIPTIPLPVKRSAAVLCRILPPSTRIVLHADPLLHVTAQRLRS